MRLRMLSTQKGTEDGFTVREYLAGREYDVGGSPRADELAQVFVREGWAEDASAPAPAAPPPAPPEASAPPTPVAAEPERPSKKKGR